MTATSEAKLNVLIVDDEPANLVAVQAILAPLGQELITARSGREALRRMLERDFAVTLLDVQMPGMDGFETAALIRERERTRDAPIIFMTAREKSEAQVFRGYTVGAVDYVFKPLDPDILRSKVSVFIELARKTQILRRQAGELEAANRELEQRAAELAAANAELEAFSYSVSHDLRAPLRAMDGYARMLQEDCGSRLDDEGRRLLGVVRESATRMGQMIDDLLQFSRLGRKALALGAVDMTALAREVAAELGAGAPAAGIEIGALPEARGDVVLLRQVWANLIGNALKYSGKRAAPLIEVGGRLDGGEAIYWVKDNGVGFDMRYAAKLFGVFQRLHGEEEFPGTGVGLATVERVIARHGGRVWAEGKPDAGATFSFALPWMEGRE